MLIGVAYRFVFVANTKTASTSIEAALGEVAEIARHGSAARKHVAWSRVREEYGFLFDQPGFEPESFFRFGVLREPVDWVRSWYNYRLGRGDLPSATRFEALWERGDWVKRSDQMSHFVDPDGECRFDLLLPHARVDEALPRICRMLGFRLREVPRKNVSRHTLPREAIPEALADRINAHFPRDHAAFLHWEARWESALREAGARRLEASGRGTEDGDAGPAGMPAVSRPPNPHIEIRKLELKPRGALADRLRLRFDGVVALRKGLQRDAWRLLLQGLPGGDRELAWGQPSPWLAAQRPRNPNAGQARFTGGEITLLPGQCARITLRDPEGGLHPVFEMQR